QPPPRLSVKLVFRSKAQFGSLPHVTESVSTFLDTSVDLPVAKACKFGSVALLNRIWYSPLDLEKVKYRSWSIRRLLVTDTDYQQFQITQSLLEAIKRKDLHGYSVISGGST
ncbi:hypothetical protein JG688_00008059, partial [Phytophthora aleatoria]